MLKKHAMFQIGCEAPFSDRQAAKKFFFISKDTKAKVCIQLHWDKTCSNQIKYDMTGFQKKWHAKEGKNLRTTILVCMSILSLSLSLSLSHTHTHTHAHTYTHTHTRTESLLDPIFPQAYLQQGPWVGWRLLPHC